MLSEVLRRDTLSQAGRARAANAKPQTDVERLLERQSNLELKNYQLNQLIYHLSQQLPEMEK